MSMEIAARASGEVGANGIDDAAVEPNVLASIWPLMLLSLVCTLPNPATNIFVGPISTEYGLAPSTVASMRVLGGGTALVIGFLAAPLLDRYPRAVTVMLGLGFVVLATSLPLVGQIVALMASFAAIGAGMAIVLPAAQAACGDLFSGPEAGRAASLVAASQTFANVVAGPILALPALVAGWQGAYASIAIAAVITMLVVAPRLSWQRPGRVVRTGYRQAFALVAKAPGAVPLLLASTVRNCAIQAWLAFLAATLTDRFGADVALVAMFWFVGAGSAVLANVVTGRVLRSADGQHSWWRSPEPVLVVSLYAMTATAPLVYLAPTIPLAFVATIVFCLMVGVGIPALVSVLLARYAPLRGTVMGLNATSQSVGIVFGTGIASAALSVGGYAALGVALAALCALSLGIVMVARRSLRSTTRTDEDAMPA